MGFTFICGKASHWENKLLLSQFLTECYPNWTNRKQKKANTVIFKDKVGESFKFSALQKNLSDNLGL